MENVDKEVLKINENIINLDNLIPEEQAEAEPLKKRNDVIQEKEEEIKRLTFKDKIRLIWKNITLEPILVCYVMPSVLASLATQNLNLEKSCRVNLNYSAIICDALIMRQTENYTEEEKMVQKLTTSVSAWKSVLQTTLPCMLILFIGAWSDRTKRRKICIIMPMFGEFLTSIGLILNRYFFNELPVEVAAFTEAIFPAMTGGWFTMFMGVFSYIGDITTEKDRTFRVGVVNLCINLGVPVGMALSGILLRQIGYYGVFSISATMYLIGITYGIFFLKESSISDKTSEDDQKATGCMASLRSFFDFNHVKDTMLVAFKAGPAYRRLRVCMLLIVVCVVIGPLHGEMTILYLFTRFRFNFDELDFSIFETYSILINLFGTLFSISVFSRWLKFDDAIIGIISSSSKILSSFMFAFAVTRQQLYLGPLLDIFNGTAFIAMRSIASKLVSSDELGKVYSLFGLAEAMMPLVYGPMYAQTYILTMNTLPGFFFLLGAALTAPAVFIFGWLYYINKKKDNKSQLEDNRSMKTEGGADLS